MSTAKAVRAAVGKLPGGKPFTGARCAEHGTRGAVDRTLSRLVSDGAIQRLAHGVFVRPRKSRFVGTVLPDVHEVVEAIARGNGGTVQIHGAEAARRFRLNTHVPIAPVFHTSASTRTIRLAGTTVRLAHTSNRRRLQFAGEAAGTALSALWYLNKNNVTPEAVATIATALGPAEFEKPRSADMPAWMTATLAAARDTIRG